MDAHQEPRGRREPNYWDYLKLDRLLDLQGGLDDDESHLLSDELHFIIVHQVYELWFKLMLRELRLARDHLSEPEVPEAQIPHVVHHLRRASQILSLAVEQFSVVETLTPQDFLAFRDKLSPASGFQSFQMREIELLLGLELEERQRHKQPDAVAHLRKLAQGSPAGALALERLTAVSEEKTLRTALHDWLYRTPIQGSQPQDAGDDAAVERFIEDYLRAWQDAQKAQAERLKGAGAIPSEGREAQMQKSEAAARAFLHAEDVEDTEDRRRARRIRAGLLFIESYRALPLLAWPRLLVDTIVELEEYLLLWRTRHARMVERTIGRRIGTGGSSGVDYLDQTTRYRIFKELWAVRTLLLRSDDLPELGNPSFYDFAGGSRG